MKRLLTLALVLFCVASYSAGTATVTYNETRTVKSVTFSWVSDATGDSAGTSKTVTGSILRVVFIPGTTTVQPTNAYDITIKDEDGIDILATLGTDLSNTTATQVLPCVTNGTAGNSGPIAFSSTLTIAVASAGNAKQGTVIIYYR